MPLGLDLQTVLAHMLNIVVLFLVLRFLLYKPIQNFMENRANSYTQREEDVAAAEKKAKELKEKYESQLKNAQQESETIVLDSRRDANKRADEIIKQAREQSTEMVELARKEIQEERANAKVVMREEVADLAVGIASRILEREVNKDDNKHIIDNFLNKKRID
ncbi:MAG: F0F1 ATP synthase subunit B [Eubacteriales bacterium]